MQGWEGTPQRTRGVRRNAGRREYAAEQERVGHSARGGRPRSKRGVGRSVRCTPQCRVYPQVQGVRPNAIQSG